MCSVLCFLLPAGLRLEDYSQGWRENGGGWLQPPLPAFVLCDWVAGRRTSHSCSEISHWLFSVISSVPPSLRIGKNVFKIPDAFLFTDSSFPWILALHVFIFQNTCIICMYYLSNLLILKQWVWTTWIYLHSDFPSSHLPMWGSALTDSTNCAYPWLAEGMWCHWYKGPSIKALGTLRFRCSWSWEEGRTSTKRLL